MKRKRLLTLLGSVCLVLVLAALLLPACAEEAPEVEGPEKFEWRFQSLYGPGAHTSNKQIIDRVAELTNGGLTIEEFFDGEIVPYDEVVQATGKGTVEISNGGIYSSGIDPALYGTQLSFSQRDPATDAWTLLNGSPFSELVREMYANHNCFYVGATEYGPLPYICSNVPIRTLDDWKGVKIRTAGPSVKIFEALGAATCWMPGSEVYGALLMGTVDAASWTCECVEEMHWNEVMDYLILPAFVEHGCDTILVNQDAWNSLPEEYQEALFRAVREAGMSEMKYWHDRNQRNLDMADEWGYEVITMSDEDIARLEAMGPDLIWPDFAAQSPMCTRMIEAVEEWYHVE